MVRCGQMARKNGPWATFSTLALIGAARSLVWSSAAANPSAPGPRAVRLLQVAAGNPGGWGDVVPLKRLVADAIGKRVGHAQGIDEVVNAVVLAQSSAHISHSATPQPQRSCSKTKEGLYSFGSTTGAAARGEVLDRNYRSW